MGNISSIYLLLILALSGANVLPLSAKDLDNYKPADQVEAVLDQLIYIQEIETNNCSPNAYFPVLYWHTTSRIFQKIEDGYFEYPHRVRKLIINFANRYLEAWNAYQNGEECTLPWAVAFDRAESIEYLSIQHLMLAMNAHINYDLGISTAEIFVDAPDSLQYFKADFDRVNQILYDLGTVTQKAVTRISPSKLILRVFGKVSKLPLTEYGLSFTRQNAWLICNTCSKLTDEDSRNAFNKYLQEQVAGYGDVICDKQYLNNFFYKWSRKFET